MEDQIKELIGLVEDYGDERESISRGTGDWKMADAIHYQIESKLRAMLGRNPLTDERIASIAENYRTSFPSSGFDFEEFDDVGFARAIESEVNNGAR